ncbi:hypothetical protein RFI_14263 [Reticulomyxa filosa]|uniref:Uncharacterized protein n=1 Tax=Reticulomyxa filosa TaxID=46433 RepID=X6NAL8_RETFI|nr:hypothetical protein RFI_14263 [Reticulomyxa filosa]|eukprot:ETO22928.1 hypothetical protein RFI_14263 [Reticulomyxa filosa]
MYIYHIYIYVKYINIYVYISIKRFKFSNLVGTDSVNHMPRNANGCYAQVKDLSKPILVPYWAGGFAFSKAKLLKEVPLDPHTPWLFHGEEFHFASRAWTHGYDFYSPPYDIMFHRYADRAKRGHMSYNDDIASKRDSSEKRINALWGLLQVRTPDPEEYEKANLVDLDKYPLGNKRTIDQFWKFVGINPITQNFTVWPETLWASGGLIRVPWNYPFTDPVLNKAIS